MENRTIYDELDSFLKDEESSFLKDELKGIDDQIKACKYGDSKGTLNKGILDEVIELFKLRKIIVGEIKKIIEGRPPEIRTIGGVDNEENED